MIHQQTNLSFQPAVSHNNNLTQKTQCTQEIATLNKTVNMYDNELFRKRDRLFQLDRWLIWIHNFHYVVS